MNVVTRFYSFYKHRGCNDLRMVGKEWNGMECDWRKWLHNDYRWRHIERRGSPKDERRMVKVLYSELSDGLIRECRKAK